MGGESDRAKAELERDLALEHFTIELSDTINLRRAAFTGKSRKMENIKRKSMQMWKTRHTQTHFIKLSVGIEPIYLEA